MRTAGNLSARQRRQLLAPLLRVVVASTVTRTRLAVGRRGSGGVDLDRLRWPDSALARDAEAQARDELTPHVLEHSYRTFVFGLSLAALDGVAVDEEVAFVASMLHDLQLEHPTPNRCFAVVGAERAERFCLEHGADADRATAIAAQISGHITMGANEDLAGPAGFVSAGAFLDVAGSRLDELDADWTTALLERHPRLELKRHLAACLAAEARAVPGGRITWLRRYAGMSALVRLAPFDE